LLNAYRVSYIRQIDTHTDVPLVPDPGSFDVEIAIANLKRYKSAGSDQIPAELIHAGDEILRAEIHKLINSILNREGCLISGRSLLLYQFTVRAIKLTIVIIVGLLVLSTSYKILPNIQLTK
jgi:hypothetical protein